MIGSTKSSRLGLLGPVDDLQAEIQGYVAEFLACRTKLNEMSKSPILTISQKANELLAKQPQLEQELQNALAVIDQIKSDVYSFSDIATVAAFVPSMVSQINDTNDLWNEYLGLGPSAKPSKSWILYGVIALGGYLIFGRRLGLR
jgi:hypothetical protein